MRGKLSSSQYRIKSLVAQSYRDLRYTHIDHEQLLQSSSEVVHVQKYIKSSVGELSG